MSFLKQFKGGYQDLWKAIIRPPKDEYTLSDLGPKEFRLNGKLCKRTDLKLKNHRGFYLECSHFEPIHRVAEQLPCVIYLHGNCSSRIEALPAVELLLPSNITLFCLDFSGCGMSEGEYISLGWFERDDVDIVVDYLRKSQRVSAIGLWGRSMGAVTSLMHADRDPSIAGMVLDSPFSELRLLAEELCSNYTKIPKFILSGALSLIRKTIQSKAKFDINDLVPMNHVSSTYIPAFFVAGKQDNFIDPHHAKDLHDKYSGDKNIVVVEGDHNSPRPQFLLDSIAIFFYNTLLCELLPKEVEEKPIKGEGSMPGTNLKESYLKHNVKMEKKIGNEVEVGDMLGEINEEELLRMAMEESMKISDGANANGKPKNPGDENYVFDLGEREELKENK